MVRIRVSSGGEGVDYVYKRPHKDRSTGIRIYIGHDSFIILFTSGSV